MFCLSCLALAHLPPRFDQLGLERQHLPITNPDSRRKGLDGNTPPHKSFTAQTWPVCELANSLTEI
jgi:hypothetical protein